MPLIHSKYTILEFLSRFDKEWKRYNRDLIAKVKKYQEEKGEQ